MDSYRPRDWKVNTLVTGKVEKLPVLWPVVKAEFSLGSTTP